MPEKLKIAVWYNLPSGGAKRALHDHLEGLVARGHTIEAWRPPLEETDYLPIDGLVREHVETLGAGVAEGRSYLDKIARHFVRRARQRANMILHSERVAQGIAGGGFDVLFANTCRDYAVPFLGGAVAIPKLLYLQEPKRSLYEAAPRLPWLALPEAIRGSWSVRALKARAKDALDLRDDRIQAADERANAAAYDRILCNSAFSRESILRAYGLDATVSYLGIDAERFHPQGLPREPFVLSVGAFTRPKDPAFLVRALGTIERDRPRLLWVANSVDEALHAEVSAQAESLGVVLEVRRLVSDDTLRELYGRATVLAYAPRLEPFGYAPLEANACGCPVVAVAEGGVRETVVDGLNGVVVPHRPVEMGEAIARLLRDPASAKAMGERAVDHVRRHWSLERATDEIERNLREVAAGL